MTTLTQCTCTSTDAWRTTTCTEPARTVHSCDDHTAHLMAHSQSNYIYMLCFSISLSVSICILARQKRTPNPPGQTGGSGRQEQEDDTLAAQDPATKSIFSHTFKRSTWNICFCLALLSPSFSKKLITRNDHLITFHRIVKKTQMMIENT